MISAGQLKGYRYVANTKLSHPGPIDHYIAVIVISFFLATFAVLLFRPSLLVISLHVNDFFKTISCKLAMVKICYSKIHHAIARCSCCKAMKSVTGFCSCI